MKKLFLGSIVAVLLAVFLCSCDDASLYQGEFYILQQAYDAGWLTQEDLKSIAYYHNGGINGNEEIMGEDYQPQPKTPEVLDKFTERSIKQSYIDNFLTDKNAKISGINIEDYYGGYDNYITIMISDTYSGTTGDINWQTIDGVKFYYNSGNQIKIWRKNKI